MTNEAEFEPKNEHTHESDGEIASHQVSLRRPGWVLLLVFGLAIFTDLILFERALGAQWAILVNGLLIVTFVAAALERQCIPWQSFLLALPISLTAILTAFRLEPYTRMALILFSLGGLVLLAISLLNGQWAAYRLREYVGKGLSLIGSAFIGLPAAFLHTGQSEAEEIHQDKKTHGDAKAVLRGVLIAIPLLIIFALLFSSADPIFSKGFSGAFSWLQFKITDKLIAQVVLVLVLTYFGFGALWHALTKTQQTQVVGPDQPLIHPFLGTTESTIILASLIALFGVFVLVQVRYFFGGGANISAEGYTYAEYARRGFFELVVVAVITWLVHYGLASFTRRESKKQQMTFSILASFLLLLTGVILVSAFQRLSLYESAYGFTRDRLVAHVFMVFVGIALGLSIYLEATKGLKHMALGLLLVFLAFSLTLSLMNVDASIARQNLEHAQAGHALDAAYLASSSISDDAVPVLFNAFDKTTLSPELHAELGKVLACRAARFNQDWSGIDFWASWHAFRVKANQLFQEHSAALANYPLSTFPEGAGFMFQDEMILCTYSSGGD